MEYGDATICCPECNQEDKFKIAANTWATVSDEGVLEYEDCEYDDNSACICPDCGFSGKLRDFMKPEDTPTP